ncbi:MAG: hypothetical protein EXX96DRAFT_570148 [Benjaminiella poitrasii]|nr:MAG: hypothetical protein EXX96DRAFT_570148 [Benjaminiella poitrasii]
MSQWNTLNNGVTDTSNDAVELQVEKLLQEYQNTLKLHQKGQIQLAKQKYEELVSQDLVKNEQKETKSSPKQKIVTHVKDSPLSVLRFLVYKNYATILEDEFMTDQSNVNIAKKALQNYLQAVKIDPTEHSLWYHIGHLSHILKKLRFARLAFETGFYISDEDRKLKLNSIDPSDALQIIQSGKYTPMQWKCLESLCQVLFDIGDHRLCLLYLNIILSRYSTWERGQQLKNKIESNYVEYDTTSIDVNIDKILFDPILITLESSNWLILADALFSEYKHLDVSMVNASEKGTVDNKNDPFYCEGSIKEASFISKTIRIAIKEEKKEKEEKVQKDNTLIESEKGAGNTQLFPPEPMLETPQESVKPQSSTVSTEVNQPHVLASNNDANSKATDIEVIMTEESTNSLKRKRDNEEETTNIEDGNEDGNENDNENDNSSNEEEDEAEEKRLSLRASKRQRDKIANEETSRLKMLEEEKEFVDKVQAFYDKVKYLPSFNHKTPWHESVDEPLNVFWEWFDNKISELDSGYCWDISNDPFINSKFEGRNEDKNLTLFLISQFTTTMEYAGDMKTSVKDFVDDINESNSGIIDSLCKAIMTIIRDDMRRLMNKEPNENNSVISIKFLELLTDIITALESNIADIVLSSKDASQFDCIFALLRISEYFIDLLIRNTISSIEETGLHPSNNSNRKKVSTSLAKQTKLQTIKNLIEQSAFWIGLVEQNILSLSMTSLVANISNHASSEENTREKCISMDDCEIQLRFYSLKGKLAQCKNNIEDAYTWYSKCKSVLERMNNYFSQEIEINLRSAFDCVISLKDIDKKLSLLEVGKLYITAKQKMTTKNYTGAIEDLERLVKPESFDFNKPDETDENIRMASMLATAYMKDSKYLNAWNCYMYLFCYFMKQLTAYGHSQMQSETRYNRNDDTNFLSILQNINIATDNLVHLVTLENREEWLPYQLNQCLIDKLVVMIKMSTYYIFRHPDFIPLVNNFTTPDMPPHRPSKITKSNIFNDIIVKSWVLQSYLFQHVLNKSNSTTNDMMVTWAELLQELHDELGEREVCGAAKSIFLHHLLDTFMKVDDTSLRREIYQCYHCLYDVHLATESYIIEEHHCTHTKLDQKAAELLFTLVADAVVAKLKGGALLKNDLKDVIETVAGLFEELPASHPYIKNNQTIIENYLNSQLTIYPSLNSILRTAIIPTTEISPNKTKVSSVFYKIFWIRGKTLRLQIKNRAKLNNEKNMMDLEEAVEEFTSHIILNPDDTDGWCELGACYQYLADEELNWSASNIKEHKDLISEYQRKAFHAYIRGIYLRKSLSKEAHGSEIYANFGNLLYSIASPPMNMEAFKIKNVRHALTSDGKLFEVQNKVPPPKYTYRLAIMMYSQAFKHQSLDHSDWRCFYMLGKCFAKIERPPREVLDWYLQAIRKIKAKNGRYDHALEPIYLFYSALVKYLCKGELDTKTVEELLVNEKTLNVRTQEENSDQDVIYLASNTESTQKDLNSMPSQLMADLSRDTTHLTSEMANVYTTILQRLIGIRAADSKGVHHRVTYRLAWMYYHVYRNTEKAKEELLKLFTLKPTIKSHITIWKPGFELPGKHYVYINKYTIFLIELAKQSSDTQTLKHLYRKLRRGQTLLLHDKSVFRMAYTSYLQIIKSRLRDYYRAESIMQTIKDSRISVDSFQIICSTFIKTFLGDKPLSDVELYGILQDLSELRRLTQGFISAADLNCDGLDGIIQMCFAASVFENKADFDKLLENQNDTSNPLLPNEANEDQKPTKNEHFL